MTRTWTIPATLVSAVAAIVCFGVRAPAVAAEPSTDLGTRHVDTINGYSLRGPAGTARRREYSKSRLVSWTRRDKSTGAIDLTLTVLKVTNVKKQIDMKAYAATLRKRLAREQQLYISKLIVTKVAGKIAIDLSGSGGLSGPGLWQRQVWILQMEGQFLILAISGPEGRKEHLNTIHDKVLASLELTDPTAAVNIRNANLKRGQDLLAGLTDAKLAAAFNGTQQWYLFSKAGKDVGYMYLTASPARREGASGYQAVSVLRLKLPKDQLRRARREQFATRKRDFCRWQETMVAGSGRYVENGIRQGDMAMCTISSGGQERTYKKRLNVPTANIFLPRAFGMVLPRLVDLTKKQTYAFATYTSDANAFDVRTMTVVGGDHLTLGARRVEAVRILDRAADDAEPATVWVGSRGTVFKMATPDGLVMEASTRDGVIRRFPIEEAAIRMLK